LAYFGAADVDTLKCLEQHTEKIKAQTFELSLSVCGYWKKPAVAWLAPISIPEALKQLARDVQQSIIPCGYKPELRDYQPHVTLVRKAKQIPSVSEIQAIQWVVNKFCLVESITSAQGAHYQVLKSWDFL
ncbi:MAG: RNA 2',3'-cyclic phosphodiesterase, partial [Gammaproteobacteria bacterium]|nr:RNA 2',3'-cyclic phosphodiesterase [Gammaproteobacteria bacterium]